MSEELLQGMVQTLTSSSNLTVKKNGKQIDIDVSAPFHRIPMMETLEEATGVSLPLDNPGKLQSILKGLVEQYHIPCALPHSNSRLLDKLVGHFIENNEVGSFEGNEERSGF